MQKGNCLAQAKALVTDFVVSQMPHYNKLYGTFRLIQILMSIEYVYNIDS